MGRRRRPRPAIRARPAPRPARRRRPRPGPARRPRRPNPPGLGYQRRTRRRRRPGAGPAPAPSPSASTTRASTSPRLRRASPTRSGQPRISAGRAVRQGLGERGGRWGRRPARTAASRAAARWSSAARTRADSHHTGPDGQVALDKPAAGRHQPGRVERSHVGQGDGRLAWPPGPGSALRRLGPRNAGARSGASASRLEDHEVDGGHDQHVEHPPAEADPLLQAEQAARLGLPVGGLVTRSLQPLDRLGIAALVAFGSSRAGCRCPPGRRQRRPTPRPG